MGLRNRLRRPEHLPAPAPQRPRVHERRLRPRARRHQGRRPGLLDGTPRLSDAPLELRPPRVGLQASLEHASRLVPDVVDLQGLRMPLLKQRPLFRVPGTSPPASTIQPNACPLIMAYGRAVGFVVSLRRRARVQRPSSMRPQINPGRRRPESPNDCSVRHLGCRAIFLPLVRTWRDRFPSTTVNATVNSHSASHKIPAFRL